MAAKLCEKARGKDEEKESKKTNSEPNPVQKEERWGQRVKGRGEKEGERTRGQIKDEMLMSVPVSPDPLISSPHVATDLSVFESVILGRQKLHNSPTHLLICQLRWWIRPVMMLQRLTALWRCRSSFVTSWPTHPDFSCTKTFPLPSPS